MQHFHVFGVRIVFRERMIEFAIHRHDLAADRLHHLRCERACRTVAAGDDDFQLALDLCFFGQVCDIARRKILDETILTRGLQLECRIEHDLFQPVHLVGTEGQWTIGTHLHAGPAIVIVRGRDNGDARHVEIELREIGHRRDAEPDVVHLAS